MSDPAPSSRRAVGALVFGLLLIAWEALLFVVADGFSGRVVLATLLLAPALSLGAVFAAVADLRRGAKKNLPIAAVLVNMLAMGLTLLPLVRIWLK